MMGFARIAFARMSEVSFWKLCGSGTEEGFTPRPNTAVYAILCVWPNQKTAERVIREASIFSSYRRFANENWFP